MRNAASIRAAVGLFVLVVSPCAAWEPNRLSRPLPQDMVGTQSCTAVSCHGGGGPRYSSGSPKGAEYVHWLGSGGIYSDGRRPYDPRARLVKSDGDPHALAAQRMHEPQFQEVLRRVSGRADGAIDPAMLQRCAKCHDPAMEARNAAELLTVDPVARYSVLSTSYSSTSSQPPSAEFLPPTSPQTIKVLSGIGCETCHGGAKQWLALHYQSGVTHDGLLSLGMIDTKDLHVRARLCAGCHIGSADQDMNHDMIAAGHPPLRFEQASYEALLGRKHWDDTAARSANPNYEVQLWAAGRLAAAAAALDLLESRSEGSGGRGQKPWPEFSESNCLACHQPLRRNLAEAGAQVLVEIHLQAPIWQTWNTALVEAAFLQRSNDATELPPPHGSWPMAIRELRAAMEKSADPDRQQVARLVSQAQMALARQSVDDFSTLNASSLLETMGEPNRDATWDELCQYVAALAAAQRALVDQGKLSAAARGGRGEQRINRVAAALRFVAPDREWPVLYSADSSLSSADVLRELTQIRQDLLSEVRR